MAMAILKEKNKGAGESFRGRCFSPPHYFTLSEHKTSPDCFKLYATVFNPPPPPPPMKWAPQIFLLNVYGGYLCGWMFLHDWWFSGFCSAKMNVSIVGISVWPKQVTRLLDSTIWYWMLPSDAKSAVYILCTPGFFSDWYEPINGVVQCAVWWP